MHILIGDDDLACVSFVSFLLENAGFQVLKAGDGPAVVQAIACDQPDLVLLEVQLPLSKDFAVCQQIRGFSDVPIIFLSVRSHVRDRVRGLQLGGDDYVTKPFEPDELLARVEVVLRRCRSPLAPPPRLKLGGITVDPITRSALFGHDHAIPLTPIEFRLLYYLMANAGRVLNAYQIRSNVWGDDARDDGSLMPTYIRRLRAKIEPDAARPRHIITVRNMGYKFEV